jgi:cation:H+ antiporter
MNPMFTLLLSLILLIIGSNFTITALKNLATRFKFSNFFMGLTLAAFATSLPELSTSIFSALKGSGEIALGNIIGSNISNLTLILGIFAVITPLVLSKKMFKTDSLFLLIGVLVMFLAISDGKILPFEGIILIVIYFVYISRLFMANKITKGKLDLGNQEKRHKLGITISALIFGILIITISSNLIVDSVLATAKIFGISEYLISLFVIGLGTSMPELIFSITSYFKKSTSIGVGNLIGSNITNPLLALGVGSLFGGFTINPSLISFDIFFMLIVTLFFIFLTYTSERIDRKRAFFFLGLYMFYIVWKLMFNV